MASLFTARRKPKRVASADSREDSSQVEDDTGPVVRRPTAAAKSKSKLRISFDPSESAADDVAPPSNITKPSRSGDSASGIILPHYRSGLAARQEQDTPVYSKSYLEELKGSTPTTPRDVSLYNSSAEDDIAPSNTRALDLEAKFGSQATLSTSAIPSAAEIQEKKDRRARLAKEQQAATLLSSSSTRPVAGGSIGRNDDYISLDAYDSDGEFKPSRLQVASFTKADHLQAAQEHTRLVPEDEDIAEGFDSFVDDDHDHNARGSSNRNRILMSRAAGPHSHDRKKLRALIDEAEGASPPRSDNDDDENESAGDSDDNSDSDASLQHAYNAAQTSRGTAAYGGIHSETAAKTRRRAERDAVRPRQPEKTTPIPTLAVAVARLRELAGQADAERQRAETRKREIERRLGEVEGEKERIQKGLEELGKQLEEASLKVQNHSHSGTGSGGGREEDEDGDGDGEGVMILDGQPQRQRSMNGNGSERERIERGLDNIGDG